MDGSIRLSAKERKACLKTYRSARAARRALVLLLLDEGQSYRRIREGTLASPSLVAAVKRDFQNGGLTHVLRTECRETSVAYWLIVVMRWLLSFTPQDFGFFRSRWSCELLALLLRENNPRPSVRRLTCRKSRRRGGGPNYWIFSPSPCRAFRTKRLGLAAFSGTQSALLAGRRRDPRSDSQTGPPDRRAA